jgi:hypothetical protein
MRTALRRSLAAECRLTKRIRAGAKPRGTLVRELGVARAISAESAMLYGGCSMG